MQEYFYKAKNVLGECIKGVIEAADQDELFRKIRNKGYYIVYYKAATKPIGQFLLHRIKNLEVAVFCKQFSVILEGGIPLVEALTLLSFQSSTSRLREAISMLTIQIKSGNSLYIGLRSSKYKFPEFMLYMIKIGEESGKLDLILLELSKYYERENRMNKKISGAMFYPATVFVISAIVIITLLVTVVPSLSAVLSSMGGSLPPITSTVIYFSSFLCSNIFYLAFIALVFWGAFIFYANYHHGDLHKVILMKLPGIGKLYKRILQIRFARALSLLFSSGMDLIRALQLANNLLNNSVEQKAILNSIDEIKSGKTLYEAFLPTKLFEPLFMSMLKIGEETGRLEDMLSKLVNIYEEETYDMVFRLTELIQPVLIVFLACIVGTIVIALMLPMMSIINIV